ncbi:MAG: peptidoglycan DD-metalloendopeptidase family protein [Maricaulaceae bacterium]|jgi:murein DD-endopeptidase MepM/ murein hydrolase activator NlpD
MSFFNAVSQALPGALLVAGLIPLAWSAAVCTAHAAAVRAPQAGDMRREVLILILMTSPVAIGALLLAAAPFAPEAPLPVLDLREFGLVAEATRPEVEGATALEQNAAPWPMPSFATVVLAVYFAGFAGAAARLLSAHARLHRVTRTSALAPTVGAHVRLTDDPVPPFAGPCGAIVLPRGLAAQFPFVRHQTARCRLAAELACDAAVLRAAPDRRADYARALLAALKHAVDVKPRLAPAINPAKGETRMRLIGILSAAPARSRLRGRAATLVACALAAPLTIFQLSCAQTPTLDVAQSATASSALELSDARSENPQARPWGDVFTVAPLQARITAPYARLIDPIAQEPRFHTGMDFGAPEGTPIVAPADGRVILAGERGGYGLVVELDHGGELKTRYAHLSTQEVATGDQVTAGQLIGRVGSTGRSTGPHLHWEVWYESQVYDPRPTLDALGFVSGAE